MAVYSGVDLEKNSLLVCCFVIISLLKSTFIFLYMYIYVYI